MPSINIRYSDDGTSGLMWLALPSSLTDDEIYALWERNGANPYGNRCHDGDRDCCGRMFSRRIYIERRGSRALVKQSWGFDI